MIENFVFAFENEGGRNWRTIKRASTKITECRPRATHILHVSVNNCLQLSSKIRMDHPVYGHDLL